MEHSFDIDIATKFGIEIAIIYKHILFWIIKNKAHNKNYKDGSYWTYFSVNSLHSIFPYFTTKQLRTILDKMKEQNIIKVGNYNAQKYDRTLWYSFVEEPEELRRIIPDITEKGKSIFPNGQMEVPKKANGFSQMGLPIPYNKTNIKTNNKTDNTLPLAKSETLPIPELLDINGIKNEIYELFDSLYKEHTGNKYLAKNHEFVNLVKTIKQFSKEIIINKIYLFEAMCENKTVYFTKNGFADFTLGKLISHWNEIVAEKETEGGFVESIFGEEL